MTITQEIAEFAAHFQPSSLGQATQKRAAYALADTVAVALAGRNETSVGIALEYLAHSGPTAGARSARLWGTGEPYTPELAALANGIAAHALDYDDQSLSMKGHPSGVLFPALIALGESADALGARLLSAYVVGIEVVSRLGKLLAEEQYRRGWHATATIGVIGSTVACSHLLGLNQSQTASAIGLAVVQAGGTQANFGTHAKHFQAGQTNASAIRSALLASKGFEASQSAIEHPAGYATLYAGHDAKAMRFGEVRGPLALEQSGLEAKRFPCCYATHRSITAVLRLQAEHKFSSDQVKAVRIMTHADGLKPLRKSLPRDGLEGKFSMEYTVAAALLDGGVGLANFADKAVMRPEVGLLMEKVTAQQAQDDGKHRWAELSVELKDGATHNIRVDNLEDSSADTTRHADTLVKVADCLKWGNITIDADAFLNACLTLNEVTVRQFASTVFPA